MSLPVLATLPVRWAGPADHVVRARLARLDCTRPPWRPALLTERDGVPVAALSVADSRVAADPFEPKAEAVVLLRLRAAQLQSGIRSSRSGLRRPAFV
jgi:hypothetical protein